MFFDNRCNYLPHNRLPAISDRKRFVQQIGDVFQSIGIAHACKVGFEVIPSGENDGGFSE